MGCASSTLNPLAGRNAVTQAASQRKKAAKDILVADKAFAKAYVAYYEHMLIVGSSLGAFFEEEDIALHTGPPAQMSNHYIPTDPYPTHSAPSTIKQLTPGQHIPAPIPVSAAGGLGMPVEPQTPPAGGGRRVGTGGGWSTDGTTFQYPEAFASEADAAWKAKGNGSPMASNVGTNIPAPPADMPPQLPVGPRGAGLAGMGRQLNQLFLESAEAVWAAREQIVIGLDKTHAALPPLPPHLTGIPVMDKVYPTPQQTLWEALSTLVAYEKQRSKQVKAMEQAKWDFSRYSRKLNGQSSKKVKVDKAAKQQQKINVAHQKVQSEQERIARLAQGIESVSYNIENIKNGMVLPLLRQLLPTLAAANSCLALLHDQQRQVIATLVQDSQLSLRVVPGATVLFTTPAHHKGTDHLHTVLLQWEEAFSAQIAAQKYLFESIILWLKKVNPVGGATLPNPPKGPPIPLPPTPSGQLMLPAPPIPEVGGIAHPHTHFQSHPPNQLMVVTQPGHLVAVVPPEQMMGQFLEGGMPAVGEPLHTLCYDWLRASDKLPSLAMKEAMAAYGAWVNEAYEKQVVELKQLKVLTNLKRDADRAEHKYESALKREREYRTGLKSPHSGPMSKTLSATLAPLTTSGNLPPQLLLQAPEGSGGEYVSTPESEMIVHPTHQNIVHEETRPLDKAGVKAQKAEDAKESKAFHLGKDVDVAKGVWEGLKVKCLEEAGSLQVMAVECHQAVMAGVEKKLQDVFKALSAYDVLQSQMYSMLKFQHAHWL